MNNPEYKHHQDIETKRYKQPLDYVASESITMPRALAETLLAKCVDDDIRYQISNCLK